MEERKSKEYCSWASRGGEGPLGYQRLATSAGENEKKKTKKPHKKPDSERGLNLGEASRKILVKTERWGWSLLVGDFEDGGRQVPGGNGQEELELGADQVPFLSL